MRTGDLSATSFRLDEQPRARGQRMLGCSLMFLSVPCAPEQATRPIHSSVDEPFGFAALSRPRLRRSMVRRGSTRDRRVSAGTGVPARAPAGVPPVFPRRAGGDVSVASARQDGRHTGCERVGRPLRAVQLGSELAEPRCGVAAWRSPPRRREACPSGSERRRAETARPSASAARRASRWPGLEAAATVDRIWAPPAPA